MKNAILIIILICLILFNSNFLNAKLTLKSLYSGTQSISNLSNSKTLESQIIPSYFFNKVNLAINTSDSNISDAELLLKKLVFVTAFKTDDYEFLNFQITKISNNISYISKIENKLKNYFKQVVDSYDKSKRNITIISGDISKYLDKLKVKKKVLSELKSGIISKQTLNMLFIEEAKKLNNKWVKGEISSAKYAKLRKEIIKAKNRKKLINKNISILNNSIKKLNILFQSKTKILNTKKAKVKKKYVILTWLKDNMKKIQTRVFKLKSILYNLRQKTISDL